MTILAVSFNLINTAHKTDVNKYATGFYEQITVFYSVTGNK